ncbi:uncharacterized protein [Dendropsophus ebraccatus]|uniref:uncharacterized protein n=1 Tax=Dendropsophus ebraccatus TaxID=150705 RepID=UPI003831ED0B
MNGEEAPVFPILDKSWLFLPVPTDSQNPNRRYLQCPATGHVYCTSTGNLYCSISPMYLATNVFTLNRVYSNFIPIPVTKSVNTKSPNQSVECNGASPAPRTDHNKSPHVKNADQTVQSNTASITESNAAPKVTENANHHMQGLGSATTLHCKSNKTLTTKAGDQPILDNSAPKTPKNQSKTNPNVNGGSDPATKKHKNKKNVKASSKNSQQQSKNKTKKQNKATVPPHFKPTTSFISSPTNIQPHPIARIIPAALPSTPKPAIKNRRKTHNRSECNPFVNSKRKSFRYYIIDGQPLTGQTTPIEINLDQLLFPTSSPPPIRVKKFDKSYEERQTRPSSMSINKCSPKLVQKPSLRLDREDHAMMDLESSFKKKTATRKPFVKRSFAFNSVWRICNPFNRITHYQYKPKRRTLMRRCKKCIMASSVHDIIHSRFAKNTNEHMPVSQVNTLLSSGVRKLRTRQSWIHCMEEEAIEKYKELNHKLQVERYDVLRHLEKSWLVSYCRWVTNREDKTSWPLLVKCLHKYPDSTLRQACTHRSFCLRWDGTSYTLRMDHAYYTEIQCHMAITNTSHAELLVHTHKETAILPVHFDYSVWEETEAKLETFFTGNILPYFEKKSYCSPGLAKSVMIPKRKKRLPQSRIEAIEHENKRLWDKVEDLENRSRRNNLRIVGVPESYKQSDLLHLCEVTLPTMLGIQHPCKVEKAHRLGPNMRSGPNKGIPPGLQQKERPRLSIVKYLDFTDKVAIRKAFRNRREPLELDGHRLLIFGDFSAEVTRRRRLFSPICTALYQQQVRFALIYPATLKVFHQDGSFSTFTSVDEASASLTEYLSKDKSWVLSNQPGRPASSPVRKRPPPQLDVGTSSSDPMFHRHCKASP